MGFLFIDDSKHPAAGFCVACAVYALEDPTPAIDQVLLDHGLQPGIDEYKSSRKIVDREAHASLRSSLLNLLIDCSIALAVVAEPNELGTGALELLAKMFRHPELESAKHVAYFDQGMFGSVARGNADAGARLSTAQCALHFEQSSVLVRGIQLADLGAHACSTMLRQDLGLVTKTVVLGEDHGYAPDEVFPLKFELWAPLRRSFLSVPSTGADSDPEFYDVASFGLFVSPTLNDAMAKAATRCFGETFMGCVH